MEGSAIKVDKKFSEQELELLNLIAEIIVEIIIKETADECDRVRQDQH